MVVDGGRGVGWGVMEGNEREEGGVRWRKYPDSSLIPLIITPSELMNDAEHSWMSGCIRTCTRNKAKWCQIKEIGIQNNL